MAKATNNYFYSQYYFPNYYFFNCFDNKMVKILKQVKYAYRNFPEAKVKPLNGLFCPTYSPKTKHFLYTVQKLQRKLSILTSERLENNWNN